MWLLVGSASGALVYIAGVVLMWLAAGRPAILRRNVGSKAIKMIYDAHGEEPVTKIDVDERERQRTEGTVAAGATTEFAPAATGEFRLETGEFKNLREALLEALEKELISEKPSMKDISLSVSLLS